MPVESGKPPSPSMLNSNQQAVRDDLQYSKEDLLHIEEWVKRHVETTWHSLGTCSMGPKDGNSVIKHGVVDERLNVHGVKGLKVADLSICPDNVGCNTYSTALLIGEKCAVLTAEDLGKSSLWPSSTIHANPSRRLLRPCSRYEGPRVPRPERDYWIGKTLSNCEMRATESHVSRLVSIVVCNDFSSQVSVVVCCCQTLQSLSSRVGERGEVSVAELP